ncbi:MAG: hypothetical protein DLM55_04440 [Acidimicrobiales bacterium]|nr:MAG: hypothetical protein DLM55_04440 [Acidimicrobiales bacterium]
MVAAKRKTAPALLARLVRDEHESVRLAVAGNPATPEDVLLRLRADSWEPVRTRVEERLGH